MAGIIESPPVAYAVKTPTAESPPRATTWSGVRELTSVLLLVALADVTIYRGAGFAGLAMLLVAGPLLLLFGTWRSSIKFSFVIVSGMLVLLTMRLIWQGSALGVVCGAALLVAYVLAVRGQRPYVSDILAATAQLSVAGGCGIAQYVRTLNNFSPRLPRLAWLSIVLPIGAVAVFGTLFIQANPDLATSLAESMDRAYTALVEWLHGFSDHWLEAGFWLLALYVAVGMLRPIATRLVVRLPAGDTTAPYAEAVERTSSAPLYHPLRNTLAALIALFAVYLVFEFNTLWFREFPQGFHYSGYAHQGAAWLTAALALVTLVLSLVFRGQVLRDPRLARLRLLAWIWSAESLVLALTVYHRMHIYIDFNGMTRMRTIGLFGISTVVVGFLLVVWKVARNRDFEWLIQRQLWALALAVFLYSLTPVDWLAHTYNVRQILAGDLAPAVQISVHPISAEGYLALQPLVNCPDEPIREGVKAMLAQQEIVAEKRSAERRRLGWTTWQLGDLLLLEKLRGNRHDWQEYRADQPRQQAIEAFKKYAYQWY